MIYPFRIIVLLLFFASLVLLQIFLSKKDSRWPGLILPILSFLFSLVMAFGIVAFSFVQTPQQSEMQVWQDGSAVTVPVQAAPQTDTQQSERQPAGTVAALSVFLMGNVPTVIYLGIYAGVRGSKKKKRQLDKMSAQDLE